MELFQCPRCNARAYFDNDGCVHCGALLAFDPIWKHLTEVDGPNGRCVNHEPALCNWVPDGIHGGFCQACALNRTVANRSVPAAVAGWRIVELAKRRLVFQLASLRLPVVPKSDAPDGLAFDILMPDEGSSVTTGHVEGVITLNAKEAEAPFREQLRVSLGEPYRTMLGHLRHEIGHYYWFRLIANHGERLSSFRQVFGDERADYDGARRYHYESGPPSDWQQRHVSAYASMHPWEDWAETWAHFMHIMDATQTARAHGLRLAPIGGASSSVVRTPFHEVLDDWIPLMLMQNALNRSMGHPDWYPFVLTPAVVDKLVFVDHLVGSATALPMGNIAQGVAPPPVTNT